MAIVDSLIRWISGEERGQKVYLPHLPYPPDLFVPQVNFNGHLYPFSQTLTSTAESITADYGGLGGAIRRNAVVWACVQARFNLLSQARFQWQQLVKGRPGDLFGNADLLPLEHPEPGEVTADLLARASMDVDLCGNHYLARRIINGRVNLKRLHPTWVVIILGSQSDPEVEATDIDAEVVGYAYFPGGRFSGADPEFLLANEVAHLYPLKDPMHRYRGMSWMEPIIGEMMADQASTTHKLKFFENGATPSLVVSLDISEAVKFNDFVDKMEEKHKGLANAYKTLYLGAGAKAEALGSNFQQLDFVNAQAKAETRMAMASGVHSVIIGATEGLSGSSLNQGNFMAARRLLADMTLRPWWANFASSLEVLIPPPPGARLWYDDRHIPFLAEDVTNAADVQQKAASTIKSLTDAGFKPDDVVDAVVAGDLSRLKGKHSGLFSVQLRPPGTLTPPSGPANGQAGPPQPAVGAPNATQG